MEPIKTKEQLDEILKMLNDQGFGYFSDYEPHKKKIDHIISNANKLGIKHDSKLKYELIRMSDYTEIEKKANEYFSKFNPDDKIFELLNKFYMQTDDNRKVPYYNYPGNNDIVAWVNFKTKYGLKDEYIGSFDVYNFDKSFIKIRFPEYSNWEFENLYELVYGEKCGKFEEKKAYGEWQNIGKIEIKLFQNGYCNIKGDIVKLKEYYYKYLKKNIHNNTIFIVNKKKEIIKKNEE
jgi:hypothetical protein